ncbi:CHAT domain-containing protein [Microbacterium sp. NPDC056234]|uniref:CHAT domain-containing protein n=1 Tax=Microbacterium sp. NPDC056234 TaxID=3345757 RepID=UPI0035DDCA36
MVKNWRELAHLGPAGSATVADGDRVLIDLPADRQPVARLRYVDGDDLFVNWIWDHQPESPRMTVIGRHLVAPALESLAQALPTPIPGSGESGDQALTRALTHGALLDLEREQHLAEALTAALIPHWLARELNALEVAGVRPHVRVQLSPSTSQLPWELLSTSDGERGIDMVDVSLLLPATLRNDPARTLSPWAPGSPVAAVLDPVVPGFSDAGELGSVLGPVSPESPLTRMAAELGGRVRPAGPIFRRADMGRVALATAAADAGRLLYVGHVTASTHALDARMHLSDGLDAPGLAAPIGAHRPYTAADIALGAPGLEPLRAPNRVALIACDSGADARYAEPTGLMAAFVHRGAEYVTATRWTLPTEAGLDRYTPALAGHAEGMLGDAIVAVDAAHEASDPVVALGAWQREQRRRWTSTGDPRFSPIIWATLTTAWAPAPPAPS